MCRCEMRPQTEAPRLRPNGKNHTLTGPLLRSSKYGFRVTSIVYVNCRAQINYQGAISVLSNGRGFYGYASFASNSSALCVYV